MLNYKYGIAEFSHLAVSWSEKNKEFLFLLANLYLNKMVVIIQLKTAVFLNT